MTYNQFNTIVLANERPVILVEGIRDLPEQDAGLLTSFASRLAETYLHAIFRTGNADGSDTAFARGVAAVDPTRLEYVLPYGGHKKHSIASSSYQISLTELPRVAEDRAAYYTSQASPEYMKMISKRDTVPQLKAKARYILRDTVKVIGAPEKSLPPATVAIFYVNAEDPMRGGTGHTIRVCRTQEVPVAFQNEWMHWSTTPRTL